MDESPGSPEISHKPERSNVSDYSLDSTPTVVASPSPTSPVHHRPGYHRITSLVEEDTAYRGAQAHSSSLRGQEKNTSAGPHEHGLAIENVPTQPRMSIQRAGIRNKSGPMTPGTPTSIDPLLSPSSSRAGGDFHSKKNHFEDDENDHHELHHGRSNNSLFEPFTADSERETLHRNNPSESFGPSGPGPGPGFGSRTTDTLMQGRWSAVYITLLALTIYSTVLSGLWFGVALHKPRYGRHITTNGKLPPATASLLCTAIAKTIELSFVTVFVALIGQILSRRAIYEQSKGFTIAEMSMRTWVMQPGTMITHWLPVRNAIFSGLGAISVAAALMAMLYTTASDALVTPKLKYGKVESRLLYGKVATSWANPGYIRDSCQTPISKDVDPENSGGSCIQVEFAGQSYHNYVQFLTQWKALTARGENFQELSGRPNATGMLYDNTTVHGSWTNLDNNMTKASLQYNRIINNISLAMPHTGIFSAARDSLNNILQPQDLDGIGEYYIRASVPSPLVNVLCAEMTAEELKPMLYTEWPMYNNTPVDMTFWPGGYPIPVVPDWLNETKVDDIFGFGEKHQLSRRHPVFPKLPLPYNTILNSTKNVFVDSIYLLVASPQPPPQTTYMLCSIRGSQTPNCSTEYRASRSGGSLKSYCDPAHDGLAYIHSNHTLPAETIWSGDYTNVAYDWATSLSLNDGTLDANASNARILSQLIPITNSLNPALPSIAEAVAVLAGCTLIMSSLDSPFVHFWNYSTHVLTDPRYQSFSAELATQDFSSGGTERWQNIFYVVLGGIFATSILCLYCLLKYEGLVIDFIEPQNLFGLSLNSPPSRSLNGKCGDKPGEEQLQTSWHIKLETEGELLYIEEGKPRHRRKKTPKSPEYEMGSSPMMNMYTKLATKRTSIL